MSFVAPYRRTSSRGMILAESPDHSGRSGWGMGGPIRLGYFGCVNMAERL